MRCLCKEPSLNDLIADPIIRAMMACDAVGGADLHHLIDRVPARFDADTPRSRAPSKWTH
jgi:hypothetical protein